MRVLVYLPVAPLLRGSGRREEDVRPGGDPVKALFVAKGLSRSAWYRIVLPAMWIEGAAWAALAGDPPELAVLSSLVEGRNEPPDFFTYDVVVLQQPEGVRWTNLVRKLRSRGVTVLYEVDDYLDDVRRREDHAFASFYPKSRMRNIHACMRACDGIVCSTEFLAEKYARFDRPIYVAENGLDLARYNLPRPPRGQSGGRESIVLMWSGATGHTQAGLPWMLAVRDTMRAHSELCFASIGEDFTAPLKEFSERTITVPFTSLECYPGAMTLGDIALAPAGASDWYKAKSQLRAMEAAALGIPVIADSHYAPSVEDGVTGYVVDSPVQVMGKIAHLLDDGRRRRMGEAARQKSAEEFSMERRVRAWERVLDSALGRKKVAA